MDRFERCFSQKALAAYLTAGDGDAESNFLALLRAGATLLEIGIPYSDPVADGPIISAAMQRSLANGAALQDALELVRRLRPKTDAPLVLFTYYNPIRKQLAQFLQDAKSAGADGILVIDLPLEEAAEYRALCEEAKLAPIFVASPSTPPERIELLSRLGQGFLYYALQKGTTGERAGLGSALEALRQAKRRSKLPVLAGFGISSKEDVRELLTVADGVVVGSYFVKRAHLGPKALEAFCHDLRP
jgi:tryptophan synthase alpha chain